MEEVEKKELPPKYYLTYFEYLLDFVQEKYRPLLEASEWAFLRQYYCLSEDARCLFIRFSNRRGLFFRVNSLKYNEIEDIPAALAELIERGFVAYLSPEIHVSVAVDLIQIFSKPELLKLFGTPELKKLKKEELVNAIIETTDFKEITEKINAFEPIIKVNFEKEVAFLKFLFFGNRYLDMTEFVVRDLGLISYHHHNDEALVARFANRKEAEDKWFISEQYELFKKLQTEATPAEIYDWFMTFSASTTTISEVALPSYERLIIRVGRYLERENKLDEALEVYQLTAIVPSRERQVRTLEKLKNTEEAISLAEQMLSYSYNADEHFFAADFLSRMANKKRKTRKSTTEELLQAESIEVSAAFRHQVEMGTIDYYMTQKQKLAVFSENHVWRAIFGLIFWDIIFDPSLVAFHHPFQRRPSDLHLPAFYEKRKDLIISRLSELNSLDKMLVAMGSCYEQHFGVANPFVLWMDELWTIVRKAVELVGVEKMVLVVHEMSKNIVENARGFPDLFVWDETGFYEFIEVKSPSDHLSNQQLFWQHFFRENDINSRVLRVGFKEEKNADVEN